MNSYFKQIKFIYARIFNILLKNNYCFKHYENVKCAFEIFAGDFIVDSTNNNVYILELNYKPGYPQDIPYVDQFTYDLFKNIIF